MSYDSEGTCFKGRVVKELGEFDPPVEEKFNFPHCFYILGVFGIVLFCVRLNTAREYGFCLIVVCI